MPKVIAIHSYRGGTGKSNFTANLATVVALQGRRVGVVDTDIPSPGIHSLLGLEAETTERTLNNYLWQESSIEEVTYDVSSNLGITGTGKLFLIPSSIRADDIARILQHGYDVKLMNDGLRQFVKSHQLDYLFIDTHPGLSKETFLSISICHLLILILRPDKQDYQGTAVTLDVARELNVRKILLAINKIPRRMSLDEITEKVEQAYSESVVGTFPLSENLLELASEGVFYTKYPDHPVSHEFRKVARQIMEG